MNALTLDHLWLAPVASTMPPPMLTLAFERPADEVRAPWWDRFTVICVACNSGRPLGGTFVAGYAALWAKLDRLVDEVAPSALEGARELLNRALFAGFAPPRLDWHGGDAVVLYWSVGRSFAFFTVDAEKRLSVLEEENGQFVYREDGIDDSDWGRFFPQ